MEEKLKKQRNKLLMRIILIMAAIWLIVSAVFCAVRLNMEKVNVQSSELSDVSHIKQLVTANVGSYDGGANIFLEYTDFLYDESRENYTSDSQILITDRKTGKAVADTAGALAVRFCAKLGSDYTGNIAVLLDYEELRNYLGEENLAVISDMLNSERDDGNYCELICTKFQLKECYCVPVELKVMLIDGSDTRFILDDDVAAFDLSGNIDEASEIYDMGEIRRNTIPKEFVLNGRCNKDIIGELSLKQRKEPVAMYPIGSFGYIFYMSEYFSLSGNQSNAADNAWLIQYARQINILSNSKRDLIVGFSVIFVFFLTISVLLCVMVWSTVKAQIIQEQKRLDLTNALAHDIKTPLFVISGYAYSLKEQIDEDERDLYIDKIIEQTDEINSLVHRMLNFSKLDSYNMKLNKTAFDLSQAVSERLDDYSALPDGKKIAFTRSGDNTINGDKELLETVLKNLIDNAVKYSLRGSEIHIDAADKTLCISNKSEPLTKSEIKELWQPYVRKDKSRHQKGNGLGLSIVKSILDLHEAKYSAEMKNGVFSVNIYFI